VTGFMSTGIKAAAFAAFVRVFLHGLDSIILDWAPVLWWIAAVTMIIGTVVGVAQTSLKRMLAYSSIAHGGYILAGLIAGNDAGKAAVMFYVAAYALTNLGAFGVIAMLGTRAPAICATTRPVAFASRPGDMMTFFLLSLGGFRRRRASSPGYVFSAVIGATETGSAGQVRRLAFSLAIIGVLSSVVSVFFYLRIVV
jgi:NADH-quinone oxidoreductase subunit N